MLRQMAKNVEPETFEKFLKFLGKDESFQKEIPDEK